MARVAPRVRGRRQRHRSARFVSGRDALPGPKAGIQTVSTPPRFPRTRPRGRDSPRGSYLALGQSHILVAACPADRAPSKDGRPTIPTTYETRCATEAVLLASFSRTLPPTAPPRRALDTFASRPLRRIAARWSAVRRTCAYQDTLSPLVTKVRGANPRSTKWTRFAFVR